MTIPETPEEQDPFLKHLLLVCKRQKAVKNIIHRLLPLKTLRVADIPLQMYELTKDHQ